MIKVVKLLSQSQNFVHQVLHVSALAQGLVHYLHEAFRTPYPVDPKIPPDYLMIFLEGTEW